MKKLESNVGVLVSLLRWVPHLKYFHIYNLKIKQLNMTNYIDALNKLQEDDILLYIDSKYKNDIAGKYGAYVKGEIYVSTLDWTVIGGGLPSKINSLIENGLTPYQALEILEL